MALAIKLEAPIIATFLYILIKEYINHDFSLTNKKLNRFLIKNLTFWLNLRLIF